MSRTIPYEPNTECDDCSKMGAFDFMGDYFCPECLNSEPVMSDEEFEQIKNEAVTHTENLMDYAGACGRMAAEFGLEPDDCPYNKHDVLFDVWQSSYSVSRPTRTEPELAIRRTKTMRSCQCGEHHTDNETCNRQSG